MNKVGVIVCILFLLSCKSPRADDEVLRSLEKLHQDIHALKDSIQHLQKELNKSHLRHDLNPENQKPIASPIDTVAKAPVVKQRKKVEQEKTPSKVKQLTANDTTYHYFDNKKISVKIAPRADRQKIWIFLKSGEIIQEYENVRMSYQVSHDIHFRSNGSIHQIKVHFNPGASRYWYTEVITFDEFNMPLQKVSNQHPADTMEMAMGKTYIWNNELKSWILKTI